MSVSVIVPTFNGERWIRDQLEALSTQTYRGEWELIIVDNGSTDDTRAVALSWAHHFSTLRVLEPSVSGGAARSRNRGAREAAGDVLVFTDVDDIVSPSWIASLTNGLSGAPIVTGPVAHFVDGEPFSGSTVKEPERRQRVGAIDPPIGCNMGIARDVFLELGGFDEGITLGWEDIDLGIRAALRGFATAWVEGAVVLRRRPSSARTLWRKEFGYGRGWTMLERRYPQIAAPDGWVRPLLNRAGWVAVRAPYLAVPARRPAWIVRAASVAGRLAERVRPSI